MLEEPLCEKRAAIARIAHRPHESKQLLSPRASPSTIPSRISCRVLTVPDIAAVCPVTSFTCSAAWTRVDRVADINRQPPSAKILRAQMEASKSRDVTGHDPWHFACRFCSGRFARPRDLGSNPLRNRRRHRLR